MSSGQDKMYLLYKKTSRRTSWRTSAFLIILLKVLCCQTLTCHPEEYQIKDQCCPMCPPGNRVKIDCTDFRSTSCLPCMNGTYMDKSNGRAQCFPCTNCDAGSGLKVKRSCPPTSDTVCEPLEGFFCIDLIKDQCAAAQKHTVCHPGQYIKEKGSASSDTVCSDCSDGTFSDGTLTSCLQHTQCESKNLRLITPGTTSTDSVCEGKTLNAGVIVGIITGVVFFLVILIAAVLCYIKRKTKYPAVIVRNRNADNSRESSTKEPQPRESLIDAVQESPDKGEGAQQSELNCLLVLNTSETKEVQTVKEDKACSSPHAKGEEHVNDIRFQGIHITSELT